MNRKNKLIFSIIFDLIGMLSFVFPPIDFVWAPMSAFIMVKMYKGKVGKIGGIISFVEEALPGLDFIPSFSLVWLYVYKIEKKT